MNILLIANSYPTKKYPLQAFIGTLCHELARQGHDVTVVAPQLMLSVWKHKMGTVPSFYEEKVRTAEGEQTIKIHRPKIVAPSNGGCLGFITRHIVARRINATAERLSSHFDIIYCHFWLSATYITSYAQRHNIPMFVASGEDVILPKAIGGAKEIACLNKLVSGVICVSTKNKEESIACKLTDGEKCIVLPNSVDDSIFHVQDKKTARKELGYPEDAFIVAYCGRFNHRKGAFRVVEAIEHCSDPSIKSIFIGRPIEGQKSLPSCEGMLHCGVVPHDSVARYLNAADVFILPTLAEGCSNSIVEAMACGLPVISSDLPFNQDILSNRNAILTDPMDIQRISQAITYLKENADLRRYMSEASLSKAKELTISHRVKNIVGFIESHLRYSDN